MSRFSTALAVSLLFLACDKGGSKEAKVDTEESLEGAELARRKAYASSAKTAIARITTGASKLDLCAELGDGEVGPTPDISVKCSASPDGYCAPVEQPTEPWEYAAAAWQGGVWERIGFDRQQPHRYHFQLQWYEGASGDCENRAKVFGDLDGDGIYSTYEGVDRAPGPPEWNGAMRNVTHPFE